MPTYEWSCMRGHTFDRYSTVEGRNDPQTCVCGSSARRIISLPMIFVSPTVCYDSPIDGRAITSMAARKEDMARSGCIEYDPMMKQDKQRRIEREEKALEQAVEHTVDAELAKMPARKRERLAAEMASGADVTPERITANVKPLKVEINNHG